MEIKCGDMVTSKVGAITGMVTCVSHRFDKITYEIAYEETQQQ